MKKLDKSALMRSILEAGATLWEKGGVRNVTHRAIAETVGRNPSGILYHFGYKMENLRDAIAKYAVDNKRVQIILQLIAIDHPATFELTKEERRGYAEKLTNSSRV